MNACNELNGRACRNPVLTRLGVDKYGGTLLVSSVMTHGAIHVKVGV